MCDSGVSESRYALSEQVIICYHGDGDLSGE